MTVAYSSHTAPYRTKGWAEVGQLLVWEWRSETYVARAEVGEIEVWFENKKTSLPPHWNDGDTWPESIEFGNYHNL